MSVLFSPAELNNGLVKSKPRAKPTPRKKEDDLLVFGYACSIYEDSSKALYFEQQKHLIPWMGDEKFLIDRYDARLHFTDQSQFLPKSSEQNQALSPEDEEMERRCDEERYCDLNKDMSEYDLYQEEEMKRFQQALANDGAYNAAPFTYGDSTTSDFHSQQQETQYGPSSFHFMQGQNAPAVHQENLQAEGQSEAQAIDEAAVTVQVEPFVPPEELEVPEDMEIPQTVKMNAIIEKTALFVSKQGQQMEILIKAKQSGNPQFEFLNFDNWLNPYYKNLLKYVKEGKYTPQVEKEPSPPPEESKELEENDESDDDDESDGEYELHPLLQASLHKKIGNSSSAASSPGVEKMLGENFVRSFYPASALPLNARSAPGIEEIPQASQGQELVDQHGHDAWYSTALYQNQGLLDIPGGLSTYGPNASFQSYVTSGAYHYHPLSTSVTSAASMIPPPPPPPGEGPLEEQWMAPSSSSGPSVPTPLPPPPQLPPFLVPEVVPGPYITTPAPPGVSGSPWGSEIVPPPPDIQPIIDKLADYVARNGDDFEAIVKKKNEERFAFLNPWNTHHLYYLYKRQLCKEENDKRRQGSGQGSIDSPTISKGPISFSIKVKEVKKPKIEYRTSVIYKQSCEQGESDEEDSDEKDEDGKEVAKNGPSEEVNAAEMAEREEQNKTGEATEADTGDLKEQMKSIEAAEREVLRLEAESRDKQIQSERRRRASLFISMLKKTSAGAGEGSSPPRSDDGSSLEDSDSQGLNEPALKRPRFREKPLASGVGAPSSDSIRVTQDLMAKVKAAAKR